MNKKDSRSQKNTILKTPSTPPITENTSRRINYLAYLIGLIAIILIVCLAGTIYNHYQKKYAIEKSNTFLQLIDAGKYKEAYQSWLSDDVKKEKTIDSFVLNQQIIRDTLGQEKSRNLDSWTIEPSLKNKIITATLIYRSQYTQDNNTEEEITLTYYRDKKSWKISNYQIHSEKLIKY